MGIGSIWHWLLVLVIVILIFGTKKLKNAGKDLGSAIHDFKEGLHGEDKAETSDKQIANKESQESDEDKKKDS